MPPTISAKQGMSDGVGTGVLREAAGYGVVLTYNYPI